MQEESLSIIANYETVKSAKNQIEDLVYQIIGLFFHIKNYASGLNSPDDHLASIVIIVYA